MRLPSGSMRNYSLNPYADYQNSKRIYFPLSRIDQKFPVKEMVYAFSLGDRPVAFPVRGLTAEKTDRIIDGEKICVKKHGGEIFVCQNGKIIPGYYEMWFSWAVHHRKNGIVLE